LYSQTTLPEWARHGIAFCRFLAAHFEEDHCARAAALLAYTTLLALVPLCTVIFVMLAAFPAFRDLREAIEAFAFQNFVPALGNTVREYIGEFTNKARGLTTAGVAVLVFTVLAMMSTIENTFNVIWGIRRRRPLWMRCLVYWAVVTLGPILIGVGLAVTSYIASLPLVSRASWGLSGNLLAIVPFVTTMLAFVLLFKVVPNRPVPLRDAVIGGIAASVLFELGKRAFTYYVVNFPSQQAIYGTFATVPIFLVWIYLSWVIVLVGAEITKCLTTYRVMSDERRRGPSHDPFYSAFRVLAQLYDAQARGRALPEAELFRREPQLSYASINQALDALGAASWISRTESYQWVLTRDLNRVDLLELMQIAPPAAAEAHLTLTAIDARDRRLAVELSRLRDWLGEHMKTPIAEVLAGDRAVPPERGDARVAVGSD
jgi:membrane protein